MNAEPRSRSVSPPSTPADGGRSRVPPSPADGAALVAASEDDGAPPGAARDARIATLDATRPGLDPDAVARRAIDVGRRTALGVLAGDRSTADDVAQEVAIQAVRHADGLRDPEALDAWLHRTAVRASLRIVKRSRRRRAVEADHVALHPRSPTEDHTALDDLARLLVGLPERQRAALTLRYVHDLDDDAIGSALRCRAGTVRVLLSRGRAALRERMDTNVPSTTTDTTTTSGDPHA